MNCTAKRGFFTLSLCDEPAARPCSACGLMTCPAHLSPASGFSQCLSCANSSQNTERDRTDGNDSFRDRSSSSSLDDADSSYRYRESYYSDRGYSPTSSSRFDANDSRAFATTAAAGGLAAADDDDGHAGFGDS